MTESATLFTCNRCGFDTEHKHVLIRHLKRKLVCKPTQSDVDVKHQLQQYCKEGTIKKHECSYCGRKIAHASSLSRHQKQCSNKDLKDEVEHLKQTIQCMQQKIDGLQQITNNTTNIENQYNQTVILNSFGKETYHHIDNAFLNKCIKNRVDGVNHLVEKIHFSDEAPLNKNVRLRSLKNKLLEVAENNKWIVRATDDVIEEMIRKGCNLMNKYYYNSELFSKELEELDMTIQNFLINVTDTNDKAHFAAKRRILALIIANSDI
jgi:hypothetical protein